MTNENHANYDAQYDLPYIVDSLSSIVGNNIQYGTLLGLIKHMIPIANFHADPLQPKSLVWDNNIVIVFDIDKPIHKLQTQDMVKIMKIISFESHESHESQTSQQPTQSQSAQPSEQLQPLMQTSQSSEFSITKIMDNDKQDDSFMFSPWPLVARAIANNNKAIRYIRKIITANRQKYMKYIEEAYNNKYISCLDSQTFNDTVYAYAMLCEMNDKEGRTKLRSWFPLHARSADKHGHNFNKYMQMIKPASQYEVHIAFVLWLIFAITNNENNIYNDRDQQDDIQKLFADVKQIVDNPVKLLNTTPTNKYKKLANQQLVQTMSLNLIQQSIPNMYEAIHDILASENINIDIFDSMKFNTRDSSIIVDAVQSLIDSLDEKYHNNKFIVRYMISFISLIKMIAKQLRVEVSQNIKSIKEEERQTFKEEMSKSQTTEEQTKSEVNNAEEITKLKNTLNLLEQTVSNKQTKLNDMQLTVDKLTVNVDQLKKENNELREFITAIQQAEKDEEENQDNNTQKTGNRVADVFPDGTILIGGYPRWQKSFNEVYPDVKIVDGMLSTFNADMFNAKTPLVLINPTYMKHSVWYKLMSLIRRYRITYQYRTRVYA